VNAGARRSRVAIAGFGAIGRELGRRLAGGVDGLQLTAVAARDHDKARAALADLGIAGVPVVGVAELEPLADIVVECAPAAILPDIVAPVVRAGKEVVVLSAGALLRHPGLIELAREHGGHISVPTGALLGLDAVGAAAEGVIHSVRMTTRKPGRGLVGAPHLQQVDVDVEAVDEAVKIFSGTAREAAEGFPANLNVAAALALAGAGPEHTHVEIWVDPAVTRNTHTIEVKADVADFTMTIENVPSENPRTGRITALSVLSLLRKRHAALRVGT
jgi:aspartate dehydrogenase